MCQALWWRVQAQWWWEEVSPAIVFNTLEMWLDGWEFPDSGHFVSMQRGTLEVIRRLPEETACTQRPEKENKGEPTRAGVSHTGTYGKVGTSWVFYVRKRWEKASWVLDPECCWAWPEFWEGARERRWRQGQEPGHCKPRWPRCLAVHLDSPKPNPVWNLWHFIKDSLSVLLQLPWGSLSALTHGLSFRDLESWDGTLPHPLFTPSRALGPGKGITHCRKKQIGNFGGTFSAHPSHPKNIRLWHYASILLFSFGYVALP